MRDRLRELAGAVWRRLRKDHVTHDDAVLPLPENRYCGAEFNDDAFFLASSVSEAERLAAHPGLADGVRILEIGCGPGRLPIGLIRVGARVAAYRGLDIDRGAIRWCKQHISRHHPAYQFESVDAQHDRYNPDGRKMDDSFRLPYDDASFDIIYLHSVFANFLESDIRVYCREFVRLLRPEGRVFLTMFIESDVEPFTINPENYRVPISGPLHLVRYDRAYIADVFAQSGLEIEDFKHAEGLGGQSELYLKLR